jgi:fatty-acyl-CoA synthase
MTGWPLVGVEIGIVDAQGREAPQDGKHIGEVIARGDGVMEGYWKKPLETDAAIRNGWLFTGDMATIDEEGYVQIVDRKKDIIVSGGENIASIEIERRLYAHDAVLECAVIAVPDPKWGEVPRAFVVLKEGSGVTEGELLDFCREGLAAYKCPRSVAFLDSLPKGGTGKILKKALRNIPTG